MCTQSMTKGEYRQQARPRARQLARPRRHGRRMARPGYPKAGMTSVANSSAERRVSANVMSPNANSSEK